MADANSGPRKRKDLWGFCAAQEFTLVSPAFHEEFLLRYQRPIYEQFGLVHYGCCENLTHKIDMLRSIKNLRSIAVSGSGECVWSWWMENVGLRTKKVHIHATVITYVTVKKKMNVAAFSNLSRIVLGKKMATPTTMA